MEVSSVAESARVVRTWESDTNFHLFLRTFGTLLSLVQYLGITRGVQEFRDSPGDDLHQMFFPNPYASQCLARQWTRSCTSSLRPLERISHILYVKA